MKKKICDCKNISLNWLPVAILFCILEFNGLALFAAAFSFNNAIIAYLGLNSATLIAAASRQ